MKLRSWPLGLGIIGVGLGGLSCEPSRPQTSATIPEAALAVSRPTVVADTSLPFQALTPAGLGGGARSVSIEGQLYRIETSARPDPQHQLTMRDSLAGQLANKAEVARLQAIGTGYEAVYTLRLRRPDGREQFSTTLRKRDFMAALGAELVTESVPAAPQFCGYLPRHDALAFTVWFNAYDTDWSASALLLLDARTGRLRYLGLNQRAEDEPVRNVLTPDGRTLLSRYAVLTVGREPVALTLPSLLVAGTRLLNARTALVVYDRTLDEQGAPLPMPRANALLLDLIDGRLLTRFHLGATATGYQDGRTLGYQYLLQTRTHYFFSPDDQTLVLIPRERPAAYRRLRLSTIPKFHLPQRPTEVRFGLRAGFGPRLTLYADTLSGALRYQP